MFDEEQKEEHEVLDDCPSAPPPNEMEKPEEFALMPEAEDMTVGYIKSAGLPALHVAFCIMYAFHEKWITPQKTDFQIAKQYKDCFNLEKRIESYFTVIFIAHVTCGFLQYIAELIKLRDIHAYYYVVFEVVALFIYTLIVI